MPKKPPATHPRALATLLGLSLPYPKVTEAVLAEPSLHLGIALVVLAEQPRGQAHPNTLAVARKLIAKAKGKPELLCSKYQTFLPVLHLAVRNGHEELALLLIQAGVDVNARCVMGNRILPDARYLKMDRVVHALQAAGATD